MLKLSFENEYAVIKFPKALITQDYIQQLLQKIQLETSVENSELSEEQAWELSEQLKDEWWKEHKSSLLGELVPVTKLAAFSWILLYNIASPVTESNQYVFRKY